MSDAAPPSPNGQRWLELMSLLALPGDESQILRRLVACCAVPGGLGFRRSFLFTVDPVRACLLGLHAVGPRDAEEAARMPRAVSATETDAFLRDVSESDLDVAAPELTGILRRSKLKLEPGSDPVADVV